MQRHRHQEFILFLNAIEAQVDFATVTAFLSTHPGPSAVHVWRHGRPPGLPLWLFSKGLPLAVSVSNNDASGAGRGRQTGGSWPSTTVVYEAPVVPTVGRGSWCWSRAR